jgi:hypothetical protein
MSVMLWVLGLVLGCNTGAPDGFAAGCETVCQEADGAVYSVYAVKVDPYKADRAYCICALPELE